MLYYFFYIFLHFFEGFKSKKGLCICMELLIIVFGCDKNINITSQLSRIGVSCLFLDTYEEFIKKLQEKKD